MPAPLIAIIEDDPDTQDFLRTLLRREGYHTYSWDRGDRAYDLIRHVQPNPIILDLWLEHPQAGSMVLGLLAVDPASAHIPVIVCTAFRQLLPDQVDHLAAQGYAILEKPIDTRELLSHIEHMLTPTRAQERGA